ncbi:MAG TPA: 4-hydroxy-3-methylbut-2-en-1-yl diphosphate synthase, partial [Planctomycetes bacterium]|nr:4-hydroxy-3-methylbut-2-en-1-yl diphosphate synthase [Planctomycetota bacterium]
MLPRNHTRSIRVGTTTLGGGHPIVVQSMCATSTRDVKTTARQAQQLSDAGAGIVRLAVDSKKDAEAANEIAHLVDANICVDLQENWRLAKILAPNVAKIRYNPGHLHHHEPSVCWQDKVKRIASWASDS